MLNLRNKKIIITGGNGFLGNWLVKNLINKRKVVRKNIFIITHDKFDLRKWEDCQMAARGAKIVFHLAARLGGADYQRREPARIFYDNIIMSLQLVEAAYQAGVEKFVTIGSITAYPAEAKSPFKENFFWNGFPEEANYSYALAKRFLAVQCKAYRRQYDFSAIHLVLPNLYGPAVTKSVSYLSHAIPIFIEKILQAKNKGELEVKFSGTGKAIREFFYVEDAAEAILRATEKYNGDEPLNLGPGEKVSIGKLVENICLILNYKNKATWEKKIKLSDSKRFLDSSRFVKLTKFKPKTNLTDGLTKTIYAIQS